MRTIRTPKRRQQFLDALRTGFSVTGAARMAGIGRQSAYDWYADDPTFAAEWEACLDEGSEALEDEARRRAFEGFDKPITYKGEITDVAREYSDTLLIFLLKGRMPHKYRERLSHEHSGTDGQPMTIRVIYGDDGGAADSPTPETARETAGHP